MDSSEAGRASWEATFNICWFGVYYMSRAFLGMLMASDEGCLVNTSSIKYAPCRLYASSDGWLIPRCL